MQKIMSILHFLGSFLKKLFTDKKFLICLAILCVPVVIGFAVVVVVYNHTCRNSRPSLSWSRSTRNLSPTSTT